MTEYKIHLTDDDRQYYFNFLDELRESGVVNMLGAWEFLVRDECLSKPAAKDILKQWMDSF